jgi:hypothetical protein
MDSHNDHQTVPRKVLPLRRHAEARDEAPDHTNDLGMETLASCHSDFHTVERISVKARE